MRESKNKLKESKYYRWINKLSKKSQNTYLNIIYFKLLLFIKNPMNNNNKIARLM